MDDEILWCEKYRPKTVKECILPNRIKNPFLDFVKADNFPNLLLSGTAGTGKTSIARSLCHDLNYEYIMINASDERNIDVVRNRIKNFGTTQSLQGLKKAIILDEADGLNPQSAQPALRAAMEELSFVKFILTCNYKNRLIEPIHSRTSTIEFNILKSEKTDMMVQLLKRVCDILTKEGIEYDQKVVAEIVKRYYPDNRKILNDLQRYSVGGKIDIGILSDAQNGNVKDLLGAIKEKDFAKARQWVSNNSDVDAPILFRQMYNNLYNEIAPESVPAMVIMLAQYQNYATVVADQEINTMALVAELMGGLEWKA